MDALSLVSLQHSAVERWTIKYAVADDSLFAVFAAERPANSDPRTNLFSSPFQAE
jgi:hypothetical protein